MNNEEQVINNLNKHVYMQTGVDPMGSHDLESSGAVCAHGAIFFGIKFDLCTQGVLHAHSVAHVHWCCTNAFLAARASLLRTWACLQL